MPDAMETLKQWCDGNKLSDASLSADGATLSLDGTSINANENISISSSDGKAVEYSVASVFLQILDPSQSLPKYRGACKKHQVNDPVIALDKPIVVGYFLGSAAAAAPAPAAEQETPVEAKPVDASSAKKEKETPPETKRSKESGSSSKHHHDKHRSDHKKRPPSSSSHHKDRDKHHDKKKRRSLVTNEQLFSNLSVVVDKRAGSGQPGEEAQQKEPSASAAQDVVEEPKNEEFEAIRKALSPEGFQVSPELLERHRDVTETIMAHEIPVGDSASVLRASSVGADLTRVLNIFLETVNPSKSHSKKGGVTPSPAAKRITRPYLVGKKPIILLPKGMTCPVNILNGYDFFANARYIPRDAMMKNKALQANSKKTTFTHKMAGVGLVEYELLDNPRKLTTKEEWERVVAVIVLGHAWQFKDWPGKYSDPVQLFSNVYGFYLGMEGEKISTDLEGWACQRGNLHRDKRGLDSVTYASFWNLLDEWVRIHRPEMLPHPE